MYLKVKITYFLYTLHEQLRTKYCNTRTWFVSVLVGGGANLHVFNFFCILPVHVDLISFQTAAQNSIAVL